ncbi:uncharacterized protein IL334_007652 [Kwoniella shivajii]|uniref:Histone deacetylase domain-containing protein n=1 Tax=Kwoniella shivajii TaxID=564305 RepID=A0ABZ1DBH9_9TREE|nr:hypothetical protein IL334_007652 [Kwoniella shivajii]
MTASTTSSTSPLGLFIQPACLQHKYIRHSNSSHIFERPERLRAVLLGVAAAIARLEEGVQSIPKAESSSNADDLSGLLSSLSIESSNPSSSSSNLTSHLNIVPPPPTPSIPGSILLHHPAVQLAHSPVPESPFPYLGSGNTSSGGTFPSSSYLKDLLKWGSEAVEKIKETGCEIPKDLGLNAGDLYLGPGSIIAIEGAIQTVCQAVDQVVLSKTASLTPSPKESDIKKEPSTPPVQANTQRFFATPPQISTSQSCGKPFSKAFCAIRPPGHHCGEDLPSGFCYVNNVVIGAIHAYLQHDIDRAIIIDFDLHHGNGTQALVMSLNAAAHAEDLQVKAGKPQLMLGKDGKKRRGWKGFYGSVHDIYSYPCEDGDVDLIKDASISLAAHGQYIENIHLQPYKDEADFYARIYPLYIALLNKAKIYMEETAAEPSRTMVFISAGFDACEHEHQGMQRHDRRVPTSFYSRYTKDIVAFADQYTERKVVSVLEGGYSDRALTSAAMGHIIGMTGSLPTTCDTWWTEQELVNIEKATKKRRNGKLAPFPSELSSYPHLVRTHTLLGHFENTGASNGIGNGLDSTTVSVQNTPQPSARMTLRDRRKPEENSSLPGSADITPPVRRTIKRGGANNISTPTRIATVKDTTTPTSTHAQAQSQKLKATTPNAKSARGFSVEDVPLPLSTSRSDSALLKNTNSDVSVEDTLKALQNVTISNDTIVSEGSMPQDQQQPFLPSLDPNQAGLVQAPIDDELSSKAVETLPPSLPSQPSIPKIILRIPRPSPAFSAETPSAFGQVQLQTQPQTSQSIYSSLPEKNPHQLEEEGKSDYRENSVTISEGSGAGTGTGTDTEYNTAPSGGESPLP